jgi:DNA-directed RNA polymerase subunit RPC12/RpoP
VCGDELRRTKRSLLERLRFSGAYTCRSCGRRELISRLAAWTVSRFARCPECHGHRLRILKRRDYIDRFNRNPFRLLLSLFKVPLYHCSSCRLQFHDYRKLHAQNKPSNAEVVRSGGPTPERSTNP